MGNASSNDKKQLNIDMKKPGMTIARELANTVYNNLPVKYKNQQYKNKIYEIIRDKLEPTEDFKNHKESMNISDLKPGDAQVNWDSIKRQNLHIFIDDVTRQLYEQNPELFDNSDYTTNNGLELKRKGGRKTRKHNKNRHTKTNNNKNKKNNKKHKKNKKSIKN